MPKPPPWAYPLSSAQDTHYNGSDRMSRSASQAIDQAMAHIWDAKVKFVHVTLSVEKQPVDDLQGSEDCDMGWVNVFLSADAGLKMEDIEDQVPRRKEHRRVPSTIAIENVKVGLLVINVIFVNFLIDNMTGPKGSWF